MKKTIGLISTFAPGEYWNPSVAKRVSGEHDELKELLAKNGYDVLDAGSLHRSYSELTSAARELRAKGIYALVVFIGTWAHANAIAAAALEAEVPVIVWGDATPGTCGLVGSAIAMGGMDEYDIHANLVYGPMDAPETIDRAKTLLDAACAVGMLKGNVLGVGGGRCMGMLTAVCDPNEVRRKFGVEIESFEQMAVIERAEQIDEARVEHFFNWMKETFGGFVASRSVINKQIRLYLALKDIIAENEYSFVASKCMPEMLGTYTSFCLAHSILGDAQDDQGAKPRTVFACEGDINAALTMQLLKYLAPDSPVLFSDISEYNFAENLVLTCNCGSQPTDFADDKKEVIWEKEGVHEHKWRYGGACPQYVSRDGRATAARLGRKNGEYQMLIVPVDVVKQPREKLKESTWERPHTFFRPLCDRDAFLQSIRSNHIHLVYGDWVEHLKEICGILGIKPIVLG